MKKLFRNELLLVLLLVAVSPSFAADDALQRVPEDAWGFLVVNDLEAVNHKLDRVFRSLEIAFPSPLTFAKLVTGINDGLNTSGRLVVALLPSDGARDDPKPLVLLPIRDYQQFARSINADESGEVCRITLSGEEVLVAQDGEFAILMNVEHRQTMEDLLVLAPEPVPALAPLSKWIEEQDLAVVILPAGVQQMSRYQPQPTRPFGMGFDVIGRPSFTSQVLSSAIGAETRTWLRSHADVLATGVAVEPSLDLRISQQLLLKPTSSLARLKPEDLQPEAAKLSLMDDEFVVSAGGPVAPGWGNVLATLVRQSEQRSAAQNGLENLSPEMWQREEDAYRALFGDVTGCSAILLPGMKGEPLVSNFLGVATVSSVEKYFARLPKVVETWSEITEQSTIDVKPEYELNDFNGAGLSGKEIVIDVATAARDPNVPILNWMIESLLGPDGKLRARLVKLNETTFVFGLATQDQLAEAVQLIRDGKANSTFDSDSQQTLKMMSASAPWKLLLRPAGCVEWTTRFFNDFLATLSGQELDIPLIDLSPPLGCTVENNGSRWQCELFCPAGTLKAIGSYLPEVKNLIEE